MVVNQAPEKKEQLFFWEDQNRESKRKRRYNQGSSQLHQEATCRASPSPSPALQLAAGMPQQRAAATITRWSHRLPCSRWAFLGQRRRGNFPRRAHLQFITSFPRPGSFSKVWKPDVENKIAKIIWQLNKGVLHVPRVGFQQQSTTNTGENAFGAQGKGFENWASQENEIHCCIYGTWFFQRGILSVFMEMFLHRLSTYCLRGKDRSQLHMISVVYHV